MKKVKLAVIFIILFLLLRTLVVFALSGVNIFPCRSHPVVADFAASDWQNSMCDVNYKYWIGSVSVLTPAANVARIALIDILPAALVGVIMYIFRSRKKTGLNAV